jgi:hypothetical protein
MPDANVIPEALMPVGPMYQSLPNELILEIFKYYVLLTAPLHKVGMAIDQWRFDILNRLNCMKNIRSVSKAMSFLAMEAFYSVNVFVLKRVRVLNAAMPHGTSIPPALPPTCFRVFLRHIQVHVALEDFYNVLDAADYNVPLYLRRLTRRAITTAKELFKYCPGARTLSALTDASTGFCALDQLSLHIQTMLRFDDETALAVIKEAAFTVRARKVTISVSRGHPEFSKKIVLFPELEALITVVSTE